jgi:tetratricopeptide (TPR) repeat protein
MPDATQVFRAREKGPPGQLVIRFVLFPAMLFGFMTASAWSVRLACADYWFRQQSIPETEKAIAFTPGQADYYFRLALLEREANNPTAMEALNRAVALNPSDARSWMELGLSYEGAGALPQAEQCLLRAAGEDRQYLPRWTLANYYFRRSAVADFWFWAKQAAGMIHGDPAPLFRLCGRVAEDGALIDRLEIQRPDIRAAYLTYLLRRNRLDLIRPASRHLLSGTRASDVPLLLTACDRLLESKNVVDTLEIWNGLADNRRIPFGRLQPAEGRVLTNGDFRVSPTLQGFDWRLPSPAGVSASVDVGGGLRLTFSGSQPENCEPLVQFVPVQPNLNYQLTFEYRTYGIAAGSGLRWRIVDQNGGATLLDAYCLSSEHVETAKLSFVAPAGCQIARVALIYRRAPGTTRIEGFLILRRVELKPISLLRDTSALKPGPR